jgi:uncharacterized protein (TIGR03435 family)
MCASRRLRLALWLCFAASTTCAQQIKFEAATVKPATPNDAPSGTTPNLTPGRLEFRNVSLKIMIYWAYGSGLSTAMNVSGGPDWINRNRYTVEAIAQGNPTDRDFRAMLRSLLEERFAVRTHSDTREIDVYALLPDRADRKLGPRVKPWSGTCASGKTPRPEGDLTMPRCMGAFRPPGLVLEGVSMIPLEEMLSTRRPLLGRIVQDRTGLAGPYNIEFEFDFNAATEANYAGPSIFTALKEQLGLKLEAAKGPLQLVIIDSANTPGDN